MLPMSLPPALDHMIYGIISMVYSYSPLVQRTLLIPDSLLSSIESLGLTLDLDAPSTAYIAGLFLCYPAGYCMSLIPPGPIKHLTSCTLGILILQTVLGTQYIHLLITSLLSYLLLLLLPPRISKTLVPAFSMTYCVLGHLHRQYINYMGWDLDFTGAQMVITIKLWSLAWNVYDGHVIKTAEEGDVPKATRRCERFALERVPGFLEFMGYAMCFSNVLAGPAFEFSVYRDAVEGGRIKGHRPSRWRPVFGPLVVSVVCLAAHVLLSRVYFPIMDPVDSQKNLPVILSSVTIESHGWSGVFAYLFLGLLGNRMKYYFAWKNSEGAANTWYCGYVGVEEGSEKWVHSQNVDILGCETAQNTREGTTKWNMKTAQWLNRYVYARTDGSLLMTYFISAFWHGFYPGYYLFFLSLPIATNVERECRGRIGSRFESGRWNWWGVLCWAATQTTLMYISLPFLVLSWEWSLAVWRSYWFVGHAVMVATWLIIRIFWGEIKEKDERKKKA